MAEPALRLTDVDPHEFIASVDHPVRRADAEVLLELMEDVSGQPAAMWGPSIINALRSVRLRSARKAGEEYLLQRRLLRTLSTGERVGPWATRFAYPFRWFCSGLNAADYFRAAALHDGASPDPRLADAIEAIRAARRPDGTWQQERRLR